MRDFAPVPFRALYPGTLSNSSVRLLAYLLMVWVSQGQPEKVEISDHELLRGQSDRLSGRRLPACGLRRNTMKKGRIDLEEMGFIRCKFLREENQQHVYAYEFVNGMTVDDERKPQQQAPRDATLGDQQTTVAASKSDALYKEEKKDKTPAQGSRDGRKRQSRELPISRLGLLDKAFALLRELYGQNHPSHLPLPNPQSARSILRNFLLDNPDWPEETVLNGIRNYYVSENTNKVAPPDRWLKRIPEFSAGPLNQYNRVVSPPDRSHVRHGIQSSTNSAGSGGSTASTATCSQDDDLLPW